jgi:hypothetical protein
VKKTLQDYFEKEKAEVCFLYQKSRMAGDNAASNAAFTEDGGSGVTEYHSTELQEPIIEPAIPHNTDEGLEMMQFASMNHQDVFLGIAWGFAWRKTIISAVPLCYSHRLRQRY